MGAAAFINIAVTKSPGYITDQLGNPETFEFAVTTVFGD